jgi:hypothetical protein
MMGNIMRITIGKFIIELSLYGECCFRFIFNHAILTMIQFIPRVRYPFGGVSILEFWDGNLNHYDYGLLSMWQGEIWSLFWFVTDKQKKAHKGL